MSIGWWGVVVVVVVVCLLRLLLGCSHVPRHKVRPDMGGGGGSNQQLVCVDLNNKCVSPCILFHLSSPIPMVTLSSLAHPFQ